MKAGKGHSGGDGEYASGHLPKRIVEHSGGVVGEKGRAEYGDAAYERGEILRDFFQHINLNDLLLYGYFALLLPRPPAPE